MLPARRGVLAPLGVHSHARSSSSSSSSSSRALTLSLPRCAQGGTLGSRLYSSLLSSPSSSSSSSSSTPLRALSMALHTRGLSTTRGVGGASPNNKSELDSLDFSAEDGSFAISDIDPPVLSDAHYSRLHNFVNKRKEDLTEVGSVWVWVWVCVHRSCADLCIHVPTHRTASTPTTGPLCSAGGRADRQAPRHGGRQ
jgi:hypothetical protein